MKGVFVTKIAEMIGKYCMRDKMKLYELPNVTNFFIDKDDTKEVFLLDHVDGKFSLCLNKNLDEVHFQSNIDVTQANDKTITW